MAELGANEIVFFKKSMIKSNLIVPMLFLFAQALVLSPIIMGHYTVNIAKGSPLSDH